MLLIFETTPSQGKVIHCFGEDNTVIGFDEFDRMSLHKGEEGLTVISCENTFGVDVFEGLDFPNWDYTFVLNSEGRMSLAMDVPDGIIFQWPPEDPKSQTEHEVLGYTIKECISSLRRAIMAAEVSGGNTTELRRILRKYIAYDVTDPRQVGSNEK